MPDMPFMSIVNVVLWCGLAAQAVLVRRDVSPFLFAVVCLLVAALFGNMGLKEAGI